MGRSKLEYHQHVLERISFADRALFRKELRKAFRDLLPADREELKRWFRQSCVCRNLPLPGQLPAPEAVKQPRVN